MFKSTLPNSEFNLVRTRAVVLTVYKVKPQVEAILVLKSFIKAINQSGVIEELNTMNRKL